MVEQRNQDGRFTPEHTDAEILAAVRAHEPAATSEVADEVGMTRQGADRRLRRLRDEGRVNSKKIAASLVWFAPEASDERAGADAPARQASTEADDATDSTPDRRNATAGDSRPLSGSGLDDVLAGWDPEADVDTETARTQTRRAVEWLATQDYAREKAEFQDALAADSTLSDRGWWDRAVRPGLKELERAGLVDYTRNQGYRWVGDGDRD